MEVANSLAYYYTAKLTAVKCFLVQAPGDNVIKLFFHGNFPTFHDIKLHHLGNNCGTAVNYHEKKVLKHWPLWQN
jgi:hypothetical protein